MYKHAIQWLVCALILILSCLVVCGDAFRSSYLKFFKSCSLAEDSDRLSLDSAADCKYACLAKQGSCAAYQWDTETNSCRLQTTLSVTKSSSGDNVGVMMETDSNVACTNDTDCAPDYTCHGINTDCGWLQSSCVAADSSTIKAADPGSVTLDVTEPSSGGNVSVTKEIDSNISDPGSNSLDVTQPSTGGNVGVATESDSNVSDPGNDTLDVTQPSSGGNVGVATQSDSNVSDPGSVTLDVTQPSSGGNVGVATQSDSNVSDPGSVTLDVTQPSSGANVGVTMEPDSVGVCSKDCAPDYNCHCSTTDCSQSSCVAADCAAIQTADPGSESGVYDILAATQQIHKVWCDMDTDSGGWTVFLKRLDGSVDFYEPFAAYQQGFGNVSGEYWLGLDTLHALTSSKKYEFRADMSDWDGLSAHSLYESMVVGNGTDYKLTHGEFSGGLGGDGLVRLNNSRFSARDVDQDTKADTFCAEKHQGGFWYKGCNSQVAYPTSLYYDGDKGGQYRSNENDGVQWGSWSEHTDPYYSLKTVELKLRPSLYVV